MNNTTTLRLPVYMKCQNQPTFKPYNKLLTNAVRFLSRPTDLPVLLLCFQLNNITLSSPL